MYVCSPKPQGTTPGELLLTENVDKSSTTSFPKAHIGHISMCASDETHFAAINMRMQAFSKSDVHALT